MRGLCAPIAGFSSASITGESPILISAWPILPSGPAMRSNSTAPKRLLVELERAGGVVEDEIRRDGMVTVGNGLHGHGLLLAKVQR